MWHVVDYCQSTQNQGQAGKHVFSVSNISGLVLFYSHNSTETSFYNEIEGAQTYPSSSLERVTEKSIDYSAHVFLLDY